MKLSDASVVRRSFPPTGSGRGHRKELDVSFIRPNLKKPSLNSSTILPTDQPITGEELDEFMETDCTYDSEEVPEEHPHKEYWSCQVCMAKKLERLANDLAVARHLLRPAEEGGLHIAVNLAGVPNADQVRRIIEAAASGLEIQKEVALSMFPKPL